MTDHIDARQTGSSIGAPVAAGRSSLLGRFASQFAHCPVPFSIILPDGKVQRFGQEAPSFHVTLKTQRALRAIASIDEGRIGDAYLAGDMEIEGDMLRPFELRQSMKDVHLVTTAWRFTGASRTEPGCSFWIIRSAPIPRGPARRRRGPNRSITVRA